MVLFLPRVTNPSQTFLVFVNDDNSKRSIVFFLILHQVAVFPCQTSQAFGHEHLPSWVIIALIIFDFHVVFNWSLFLFLLNTHWYSCLSHVFSVFLRACPSRLISLFSTLVAIFSSVSVVLVISSSVMLVVFNIIQIIFLYYSEEERKESSIYFQEENYLLLHVDLSKKQWPKPKNSVSTRIREEVWWTVPTVVTCEGWSILPLQSRFPSFQLDWRTRNAIFIRGPYALAPYILKFRNTKFRGF